MDYCVCEYGDWHHHRAKKAMADIFISYAREDQETGKMLAQALEDQGWSVWWDQHISVGMRFPEVIERELTAARCVIALWSTAAIRSPWVREEAEDGLYRHILVPAMIETVRLPLGFRTVQTADLIGWAGDQNDPKFALLFEHITTVLSERPPKHFWFTAEKYMEEAISVWATAVGQKFERPMDIMHAMPVRYYFERVLDLATQMSKGAGDPSGRPLNFWVFAQNHIAKIACLSVAKANTADDAIKNLAEAIGHFNAKVYLDKIRLDAFFIWQKLGQPSQHALDDWLKAECQALSIEPQR